ncbi:MAG: transcriptional regulator [Planctomycetota bacterium]|nr:MAG: transcriptional regulator [Planctomycetota bacterium]
MKNMSDAMVSTLVERFRALADPTRIRVINQLMGQGACTVGQLAADLAVGQASVSKHLDRLRAAGLVAYHQQGNQRWYRIIDPSLQQLCELVCGAVQRQAEAAHNALCNP